jgi:hypothetical protein
VPVPRAGGGDAIYQLEPSGGSFTFSIDGASPRFSDAAAESSFLRGSSCSLPSDEPEQLLAHVGGRGGAAHATAAAAAAPPPPQARKLLRALSAAAPAAAKAAAATAVGGAGAPDAARAAPAVAGLRVGCWNSACTSLAGATEAAAPLKPCAGGCGAAAFCSRACASAAYASHRAECVALFQRSAAAAAAAPAAPSAAAAPVAAAATVSV